MTSAADYIREMSATMADHYSGDCVAHACRAAEILFAAHQAPWIGVIRDISERSEGRFHGPLIPSRYAGKGALAWSTHYVACCGRQVFDPLAGVPLDMDEYGQRVFGRQLVVAVHLDAGRTASLVAAGEIRSAFGPAATP